MNKKTLVLLAATLAPGSLQASVLAQYTFDGASTWEASTEAAGVEASGFTAVGGSTVSRTFSAITNLNGFTGINTFGPVTPQIAAGAASSLVAAKSYGTEFAPEDFYFQFSVASPDVPFSLASLVLDAGKGGGKERSFQVIYSIDDFATYSELGGATFAGSVSGWALANFQFDLTGVTELQGINQVSFRLLADVTDNNTQFAFDNVTINAIPESSSALLAGLGALALLRRRRC